MTRNRKADLQRKLTMAPVAKPPAGLADRIKRDIPGHFAFQAENERTQLRKSAMFNLRIAASIILLVSSLYLTLHLVSRNGSNIDTRSMMTSKEAVAPATRANVSLPNTPPAPGSARAQERADLPPLPRVPPPTSIAAQPPRERIVEARHEESVGVTAAAPVYVADTTQTTPTITDSVAIVNATPAGAIAAPPPAPPLPSPVAVAEAPMATAEGGAAGREPTIAKSSAAPALSEMRDAKKAAPARNFVAVQQAISRGESPRDIDAFTFVQHFAAPERKPADLHVELEASATPLDATKWLLRVSVDAPGKTSTPIDLTFGDAVTVHRSMIGSVTPNETALYEIEFKPDTKPDETIATVRAGNAKSTLRVADLHPWSAASPRMKRVSLAAAWARAPQSRKQTEEIVAKAREAHIDDLADIAEQSVRIR